MKREALRRTLRKCNIVWFTAHCIWFSIINLYTLKAGGNSIALMFGYVLGVLLGRFTMFIFKYLEVKEEQKYFDIIKKIFEEDETN